MDNLITDLLAKRNFSQARKAIEKKLKQKKYDGDHGLQIAKARALFGLAEYQACLVLCSHLCQDGVHFAEDVNDSYALLRQLSRHVEVEEELYEKLWRGAVAKQPKGQSQLEWCEEWATQAIKYQHWNQLMKAAQSLKQGTQAGSNGWRKYSFWLIVAQWLASTPRPNVLARQNSRNLMLSRINAQLATRQLQEAIKTAEANVQDGNVSTSNKLQMEKLPEMKLLLHILKDQKKYDDIVTVLSGSKAKSIAGDDDDMAIAFQEAILATKNGADSLAWLKDFLETTSNADNASSRIDDWQVWKALLALEGDRTKDVDEWKRDSAEAQQIAQTYCDTDKPSRGPWLAKFELQCSSLVSDNATRQQAFLDHFERHASSEFIVDDLQRNLGTINGTTFKSIRDTIAQSVKPTGSEVIGVKEQLKWLTAEINTLKLDLLYLKHSQSSQYTSTKTGDHASNNQEYIRLLEALIVNALSVYRLSRAHTATIHEKAMHPGDQACLVAVDALLVLGQLQAKVSASTLQALCLLDFVLADNRYNFLARTQLTGLSQTLGLYTLASPAYQALDVKEVLHETMCPLLFLRIGSMHAPALKGFNSYDAMTKALEFYSKSLDKIPDYQSLALDHANYSQVIHMHQFREQLYLSPTRLMLLFERKRLARLMHDQIPGASPTVDQPELADELRNAYTGSVNVPKRAQPDRHPGPALTKQYNEWLMIVDLAFELTRSKQLEKADIESGLHTFMRLLQLFDGRGGEKVLTDAELNILKASETVFSVLLYLVGIAIPADVLGADVALSTLHDTMNTLLEKYSGRRKSQLDILPQWTDYHEAYLTLELCQVLDALVDKVQKVKPASTTSNVDSKAVQESAKAIKVQAKDLFERVQKQFAGYVKEIVEYGSAQLLELVMGGGEGETGEHVAQAVYNVMGEQNVRRFLQGYVNSAKVSIDAVLSIKLRK